MSEPESAGGADRGAGESRGDRRGGPGDGTRCRPARGDGDRDTRVSMTARCIFAGGDGADGAAAAGDGGPAEGGCIGAGPGGGGGEGEGPGGGGGGDGAAPGGGGGKGEEGPAGRPTSVCDDCGVGGITFTCGGAGRVDGRAVGFTGDVASSLIPWERADADAAPLHADSWDADLGAAD